MNSTYTPVTSSFDRKKFIKGKLLILIFLSQILAGYAPVKPKYRLTKRYKRPVLKRPFQRRKPNQQHEFLEPPFYAPGGTRYNNYRDLYEY